MEIHWSEDVGLRKVLCLVQYLTLLHFSGSVNNKLHVYNSELKRRLFCFSKLHQNSVSSMTEKYLLQRSTTFRIKSGFKVYFIEPLKYIFTKKGNANNIPNKLEK